MDRNLRRFGAVARDEYALKVALAEHDRRRFDTDVISAVRVRTEDLLETLSFVAHDDEFWDGLVDGASVMTVERLERLREFDPASLGIVLEAAGYRSPPPPPVDELVEDTAAAMAVALATERQPSPADVLAARSSLITLVMRVRRQVQLAPSLLTPAADRGAARALLRGARVVLPIAAGAAAGALVESLAPGSGLGLVVGKAAAAVADHGVAVGTVALLGLLPSDPGTPPPRVVDDRYAGPSDAITAHLSATKSALSDARQIFDPDLLYHRELDPQHDLKWCLGTALRHVRRIRELVHDHAAKSALIAPLLTAEEALAEGLMALARTSGTADAVVIAAVERAKEALDTVHRIKGDRVDWDSPAQEYVPGLYSLGPFAEATPTAEDNVDAQLAQQPSAARSEAEERETKVQGTVIGAKVEQKETGTAREGGQQLRRSF